MASNGTRLLTNVSYDRFVNSCAGFVWISFEWSWTVFSFHILTLIISTGELFVNGQSNGLTYSFFFIYVLNSIKYVLYISIGALTILRLNRCTVVGNKRLA